MIIASIDIGTNTVLLLIAKAEKESGKITPILNEHRMPRLGKGLIPGKAIMREKIDDLYEILTEYSELIKTHSAEKVLVTATNAFRIASNAADISNEIKQRFGWNVNIIDGKTEAEFAFLGASPISLKDEASLVIDIGGGSTELIFGKNKKYSFMKSFPIGSVSAAEKHFKNNPPTKSQLMSLNTGLGKIFEEIEGSFAPDISIAIAGTPTTLVCISKGLKEYDEFVVEGSYLMKSDLVELTNELSKFSSTQIKETYGNVVKGREDIILAGSCILLKIMELLNLSKVIVSSHGIRYGAIVSFINENNYE